MELRALVRLDWLTAVLAASLTAQESEEALLGRVDALVKQRNLSGAIEVLDEALRVSPERWRLWHTRAFWKGRAGDLEGGIADATRVIELAPNEAAGWIERGYLRMKQGAHAAALADFDRAVEVAPREPTAFGDRGDCKQAMGDLFGAKADYDRAIELRPDYGAAWHNRAMTWWQLGVWKEAVADQRKAIRCSPPMARMWDVLARAQLQLGQYDDAVGSASRAIGMDGDELEFRFTRADANLLRGRARAAAEEFARVIAKGGTAGAAPLAMALRHQRHGCYLLLAGDAEGAREALGRAIAADGAIRPWAELMLWCAASDPAADTALVEAFRAVGIQPDAPMHGLMRVCLGELTPEQFAAEAPANDDAFRVAAWFLAGWRARRAADEALAARCFRRAVATGSTESIQYSMALVTSGRAKMPAPRGALDCSVRAVANAEPPELEIASLVEHGAAALQGFTVGHRIRWINDQPATLASFAAVEESLVIGTRVRLVVVDGEATRSRWLIAGDAVR
jgi:tetratricopeptide (TPR) repeat protein